MTYDTESTELAAVVSSGQKVDARTQSANVKTSQFSDVVLTADGQTGQLTERLPAGAKIIRVVIFLGSGTGDLDIGLDTGGASDVAALINPATSGTLEMVDNVVAGNAQVYATADTAAVTFSGYIEWTAGA